MRILVTGGNGQVGARVAEHLPGHDVLTVGHAELDIADREAVEQLVGEFAPARDRQPRGDHQRRRV